MIGSHTLLGDYQLNEFSKTLGTKFYTGIITAINYSSATASVTLDGGEGQLTNVPIIYHVPNGISISTTRGAYAFKVNDPVMLYKEGFVYKIFAFLDGLRQPNLCQILFSTGYPCYDIFYNPAANEMFCMTPDGHRIMKTNITGTDRTYWTPYDGGYLLNYLDALPFNCEQKISENRMYFNGRYNFASHIITGVFAGTSFGTITRPPNALGIYRMHYCNTQNALYILDGGHIIKREGGTSPVTRLEVLTDYSIIHDFCHDCANDTFYIQYYGSSANKIAQWPWNGTPNLWNFPGITPSASMQGIAFNPTLSKLYLSIANKINKTSYGASAYDELICDWAQPMRLKYYDALYIASYGANVIKFQE